ncbi:MAG TPA: S8 family serine peptidase [Pyrinomonadaceae bacterium]|nr:S8 family serine peptidase [Pyrinomonadaceae bacterium]
MKRTPLPLILSLSFIVFALIMGGLNLGTPHASAANATKSYVVFAGQWGPNQNAAVGAAGGQITYSHKSGVAVVTSDNPNFLQAVAASNAVTGAAEDQMVQWQPNVREVQLEETAVTPGDETFINAQWNVQSIEAPAAWAAGYTGQGVRVAVLDGGIHSTHQDLDGNLDVARSTSFVPGFAFNQDVGTFWHGTHVAGIVAAEDNALGTIGVAPGATIIGVKVLHNGSGSFGGVIAGILYASTPIAEGGAGADIINMSLGATFPKGGGPGTGQLISQLNKAVNFAGSQGVLVVSATGNDGLDLDHSGSFTSVPAMSGSGIAVSSTGPVGFAVGFPNGAQNFRRPSSFTNFGNSIVTVAGPGGDFVLPGTAICALPRVPSGTIVSQCWVFDMVLSTSRGAGASTTTYSFAAGTSMATPAVSGVAALIKQRFPGISLGALKAHLTQTADDEGKKGNDPFYGKGFVNARRAVTE